MGFLENMKYVLVTGGVVSGLGKGVTASSMGVLLQAQGLRVTSIKIGERRTLAALRSSWLNAKLMHALQLQSPNTSSSVFKMSLANSHSNVQSRRLHACTAAAASLTQQSVASMQTRTSTRMPAPCRPLSTARCLSWTTAARCVQLYPRSGAAPVRQHVVAPYL